VWYLSIWVMLARVVSRCYNNTIIPMIQIKSSLIIKDNLYMINARLYLIINTDEKSWQVITGKSLHMESNTEDQ